jgi:hypothetical protein
MLAAESALVAPCAHPLARDMGSMPNSESQNLVSVTRVLRDGDAHPEDVAGGCGCEKR